MVKYDKNGNWKEYDEFKQKEIIEFIKTAKKVLNRCPSPFRRKRYGKDVTPMRYMVIILLLRELLNKDYRGIVGFIKESKEIQEAIGLKKVPHFTTVHQFAGRIPANYFKEVYKEFKKEGDKVDLAADATGFSSGEASHYYTTKIKGKTKLTEYIKLHGLEDIKNQLMLSLEVTRGKKHESPFFVELMKKLPDSLKIGFVTADKAYDSKKNHRYVQTVWKADSVIKLNLRGRKEPKGLNKRRRSWKRFEKGDYGKKYGQRSLIESVFSVIKRVFGWSLKAIKGSYQRTEVMLKVLAYNIRRRALLSYY